MKNKRRIIGIVAATLLALVGTISLVGYVRSAKEDAVAQETLVDVYVVDEFVPKGAEPGTIMSAVSVEQVPARLIQDGALTDLDQVGDQVAASDLQPGDQLLAALAGWAIQALITIPGSWHHDLPNSPQFCCSRACRSVTRSCRSPVPPAREPAP